METLCGSSLECTGNVFLAKSLFFFVSELHLGMIVILARNEFARSCIHVESMNFVFFFEDTLHLGMIVILAINEYARSCIHVVSMNFVFFEDTQ